MKVARARLILGLMLLAATLSIMPGGGLVGPAEGQSREAETLLKDLAGQLGDPQGDYGSFANDAAWEDTAPYLRQRYGTGDTPRLTAKPADAKGETSTWSTSTLQGDHRREILASWDRDKGKLNVTVLGDANGSALGREKERVGKYFVHIQANVAEERDERGNPILRARLPKKGGVLSLAEGCDEEDQVDLNGEWEDNQGKKWVISHTPFKCGGPESTISLTRTNSHKYEVVHQGTIKNWQITAEHKIENVKAIEDPKEDWVRQEIASGRKGKAKFNISLSPRLGEDGTLSLEGTYTGYNVKWNPDEKVVKSVEPGYKKPLVLTPAVKKEKFRIVRVEVDTDKWKSRLLGLQYDTRKIKDDIELYAGRLKEAHARFEKLQNEKEQVMGDLAQKFKKMVDQESSLKSSLKVPVKPTEISEDLQQKLREKDDCERQIDFYERKLIELAQKQPPKWSDLYSKNEKILNGFRSKLEDLTKKIKPQMEKEYAKKGFDPKKEQEKMKQELIQLQDEYYGQIKAELTPLDSNLRDTGRIIENLQKNINNQEVRLTDLQQKLKELDEQDTPFINRVIVFDGRAREMGLWENWGPFEAIKQVNEETERLGRLLKEYRTMKEESEERFLQAAQEMSQALDQVTRTIMKSAYIQAGLEGLDFLTEVAKGYAAGNIWGAFYFARNHALSVALNNLLMGEELIETSDPQALEKEWEQRYGFKPSLLNELDTRLLKSSGLQAILKEAVFDTEKQKNLKQAIPLGVKKYYTERFTNQLISSLKTQINPGVTVQQMEILTDKLKQYSKQVKDLKAARRFKLQNFIEGFFKEFLINVLKRKAQVIEDQAWLNYFEKDLLARASFAEQQVWVMGYWDIYDQYMAWQWARNELVKGYDPSTGFKEMKSKSLWEGRTYAIGVEFQNPKGVKEKVWLGLKEAGTQGAAELHRFRIQAVNLKSNNEKGDVVLKIEVQ